MKQETFYICMFEINDSDEYVISKSYEVESLDKACKRAEELRSYFQDKYPLINVQYSNGNVYADYEL